MPGRVPDGQAVRQDLLGDGGRDPGAVDSGEDPVHSLQDGGEAIRRAAAEPARVEERQVVLRVAQGQHVVRRQAQDAQRLLHPGALGDAGGQQHERGAVVDEVPRHARGGQRLLQGRLRPRGAVPTMTRPTW